MTDTLLRSVTGRRFLVSAWPWRGFAYAATTAVAAGLLWLLLPVLLYLTAMFGGAHAALARILLHPEPSEELVEVARSRTRLVHAFDAERLRIERDLHDIAQRRLVALTMQIGMARLDLPPSSPAAAAMASAHDQAKTLMAELRDLIRGISPRTLRELDLPVSDDTNRRVLAVLAYLRSRTD